MRRTDMRTWTAGTKVSATARFVFLLLGLFDRDGEAWPSVAMIVELSGLARRTVQYALRELEDAGEVVAERRQGHSTRYQLYPQGGARVAPQGAHQLHPGGANDDQKGRTSCTQKELKELKKESAVGAALSTRASAAGANGALTHEGRTFLPGTGWL